MQREIGEDTRGVDGADDDGDLAWRRHRFRALYDASHDDLWRYCLHRAANTEEAEDVLNETFTVAWRRFDAIPPGDQARAWLFGVARRQLQSGWRKYRRNDRLRDRLVANAAVRVSGDSIVDPAHDPAVAASDGSEAVLRALAALNQRDQEILRLAAWEELPHNEIAELLGCSENAVAIRLHRARKRLTKAIGRIDKGMQP